MENIITKTKEIERLRTVTFLTRAQIDFLDKLGKDALFLRGLKLSRAQILSQLVNLLIDLKIDINKIDLKKESLEEGILETINKNFSGKKNEDKNSSI